MERKINKFFRPVHPERGIADSGYACTAPCVAMAGALSRSFNHSLYIIDCNRRNFLCVSPNLLSLRGRSREEVQRQGHAFYFEIVPPDGMRRLTCSSPAMPAPDVTATPSRGGGGARCRS